MNCCPLLAWRSTSRSWAESRWAWYSAGASPRCTLNSYRPEGKTRPGLPGGEHLRRGYASSARPPSARDPTHERRVAGGHRRQSRRSPPALPLDQRDGPSASRTRTQAGKHWGTPSCAPPRSGSPSRLPAGSAGQARRRRWSGLGHGSTTMGRCCVSARCKTPASCCKPAAPGGLRQPLVRRSWTRRGSWRSSSGGDPYRMSISLSAAAASRIARRSAPSGVRYRVRRPAS
jgi:hypothetical protein